MGVHVNIEGEYAQIVHLSLRFIPMNCDCCSTKPNTMPNGYYAPVAKIKHKWCIN